MNHIAKLALIALTATSSVATAAGIERSMSPNGAKAYIVSPADGATVGENVTVIFGLKGMGVSPAGLQKKNTGHHHLMVDMNELPDMKRPLGSQVKHFGGGQTQKTITLPKGKHTLQLLLGNHMHVPHNPPVLSRKITITVK